MGTLFYRSSTPHKQHGEIFVQVSERMPAVQHWSTSKDVENLGVAWWTAE